VDHGAVQSAPYRAGLGIVNWVRKPGRWHELEGECLRNGVDLRALTFDRFLNVVYRAMIDRLTYDHEHPDKARTELDRLLEVETWAVPGLRSTRYDATIKSDAPAWWHGDEDASQVFLHSMGVMT